MESRLPLNGSLLLGSLDGNADRVGAVTSPVVDGVTEDVADTDDVDETTVEVVEDSCLA